MCVCTNIYSVKNRYATRGASKLSALSEGWRHLPQVARFYLSTLLIAPTTTVYPIFSLSTRSTSSHVYTPLSLSTRLPPLSLSLLAASTISFRFSFQPQRGSSSRSFAVPLASFSLSHTFPSSYSSPVPFVASASSEPGLP